MIVVCAGLIVLAEGVAPNLFTLWNLVPLFISYLLFAVAIYKKNTGLLVGAIGYSLFGIGISFVGHTAWYFDWYQIKTASSTSALIFIFLPVFSLIIGILGYTLGRVIEKFT